MDRDEIKYSLLEIMEGPKRINNISHTLIFDYLLEAAQDQERFEAFMRVLLRNAWWAYYGICIMASDILPTDTLFEEEKNDLQDIKYRHGSINELSIFNMLLSYFERGLFEFKKHRTYFVRYMAETLSDDEYKFCVGCIYKQYKDKIYPCIKKMYENGHLARQVHHFFSFCMNHAHDEQLRFTPSCLPVRSMKMYWKIGDMIFDGNKPLDKQIKVPIITFIKRSSIPTVNYAGISYPMICEIWVDEKNNPIMVVSTERAFILRSPTFFDDRRFIDLFYSGYKTFICVNGSTVVSVVSEQNGFVKTEIVKYKKIDLIRVPLLILGMRINIAQITLDEAIQEENKPRGRGRPKKEENVEQSQTEEDIKEDVVYTAFVPGNVTVDMFTTDDNTIKLVKFYNTYYVSQ